MEQDGGGQAVGDQFSGFAVSVEEVGDGVRCEIVHKSGNGLHNRKKS